MNYCKMAILAEAALLFVGVAQIIRSNDQKEEEEEEEEEGVVVMGSWYVDETLLQRTPEPGVDLHIYVQVRQKLTIFCISEYVEARVKQSITRPHIDIYKDRVVCGFAFFKNALPYYQLFQLISLRALLVT